jgi:hypothetical protein
MLEVSSVLYNLKIKTVSKRGGVLCGYALEGGGGNGERILS